jgi:sensor c-di-GMP phosphodiesterase-like protein
MKKRFIPSITTTPLLAALLASSAVLGLAGCNRQESASDTAKDMSEERREGNEAVVDAQKDAAENQADSMDQATTDAANVEMEKVKADYEVAKERCDGVPEDAKEGCRKDAQTEYDRKMNELRAMKP